MDASNVYLTQTDTTVGFLCNNDKKLSGIKKRPISQKILQVVDSFSTLKQKVRVPNQFKKNNFYLSQWGFISCGASLMCTS
jgi:tRNA A37 threonylcarbamoyladenosine synthetase subunit TsaC/SUA5/YrdC